MFAVWTVSSMHHTYCVRFCHVMRIEAEGSIFVRQTVIGNIPVQGVRC